MFTIRITTLILILQLTVIQMFSHNKPLAEKIWSERCQKNSMLLNDCNWCRCTSKMKYDCRARICEEIDMFGHFNDAIQEIDVGMEGHGSWRSRPQPCTPGVHYTRGAVLCICDEDGNWPNPVCRDLFQILHAVEVTGQTQLSKNDSCSPTKLYLVGCNVCFCPSSGYLDPQMCTYKECQDDDPVIEANQTPLTNLSPKNSNDIEEDLEIYAMCDPKLKYELGCRSCDCLRNNRLLCGNCSTATDQFPNNLRTRSKQKKNRKKRRYPSRGSYKEKKNKFDIEADSICDGKKPHTSFLVDCNTCHCNKNSRVFCTLRYCLHNTERLKSLFNMDNLDKKRRHYKEVAQPPDDESCKPGTIYKRDCNTCICGRFVHDVKEVVCTREFCRSWRPSSIANFIESQLHRCVQGTYYRVHCKICHCFVMDSKVFEACRISSLCLNQGRSDLEDIEDEDEEDSYGNMKTVKSLSGYCVPMRRYTNDCNTCQCMSDARTVECTSKICPSRSALRSADDQLSAEIVPVVIEGEVCPKGQSYKLDCNVCFCLSNGNAICTTTDCSKQNKLII